MKPLSSKRKIIYDYICECIRDKGYPPSVREICSHVGLSSTSTVHAHLNALESMGYISRSQGRMRAITLSESPRDRDGVPVLGSVAAGEPILAIEDALGYISYENFNGDEHFALVIRGDSMIKAGIMNGDTVIVHRQSTAEDGDIVIALIGDEATCKRLSHEDGNVFLLPENDDYSPIPGNEASLLGKVVAVVRTY